MYQHAVVMEHLGTAPELRFTPSGRAVATLTAGVNRH